MNQFFGIIFWVRLFLSPFIIGILLGGLIIEGTSSGLGLIIGLAVILAGTLTGAVFAERIRTRRGTMAFIGQL